MQKPSCTILQFDSCIHNQFTLFPKQMDFGLVVELENS